MEQAAPNRTLFVARLPGNVRLSELKRNLYLLFTQYGRVTGLNFPPGKKIHNFAFVVFQDVAEAVVAKQSLDNFYFLCRQIKVDYSKNATLEPHQLAKDADHSLKKSDNITISQVDRSAKNDGIDESNKILFVENLPENFNEESVANIFGQLQGYKESRMVSGNSSIAFVEFSNESFASVAKNIMNNHRIDHTHELRVSFAKK